MKIGITADDIGNFRALTASCSTEFLQALVDDIANPNVPEYEAEARKIIAERTSKKEEN